MRNRYPQQRISVFDIFKVGIGPSSSHTTGPWRAAERFVAELATSGTLGAVRRVLVELYGSLAKTGLGHGTDLAVYMGLAGYDPVTVDPELVRRIHSELRGRTTMRLEDRHEIPFSYERDIRFVVGHSLDYHPNGLTFTAELSVDAPGGSTGTDNIRTLSRTYFSIGGGFVVEEGEDDRAEALPALPYPIDEAADILRWTRSRGAEARISDIVWENERVWDPADTVSERLLAIYETMRRSVFRGLCAGGTLPGGLEVRRRAGRVARPLMPAPWPADIDAFFSAVSRSVRPAEASRTAGAEQPFAGGFEQVLRWVSCFALAVNEENADFGRVVTAPTNGAAGVLPAVLLYYTCFVPSASCEGVVRFLLTAGEIGSVFKKGATISAAQGGCQAEIGVSSAMAAAGLTELRGGSPDHALMAAEISMEHHLGLTCDPVGGLVQVPCIERNTMGAVKAITASSLALASDPAEARVSLDRVIETMWHTALDMDSKYKETSEGGLAAGIAINVIEC